MGLKTFGGGWDPGSGWAPDDSTGVQYQDDVEIPGQFRGRGQGFGPGGFPGNPRLVGPSTGQSGVSLSSVPGGGSAINPDEVIPPTGQPIRRGMNVGRWTNPFTEAHINPQTGQPEMLPQGGGGGPGMFSRLTGWLGRGAVPAAIATGGAAINAGIENEKQGADAGLINPHGTGPRYSVSNLPLSPNGPLPGPGRSITGPQPIPMGMPGRDVTPPQRGMPWPDTGVAPPQRGMPWPGNSGGRPAVPAAGPAAAAPAAAAQQPNLGAYNPFTTIDRPNMSPQNSAFGHQGNTTGTALDLSRLFGGGQAAAATPPLPPVRPKPAGPLYRQPSAQLVPPGPMDPSVIAQQKKRLARMKIIKL